MVFAPEEILVAGVAVAVVVIAAVALVVVASRRRRRRARSGAELPRGAQQPPARSNQPFPSNSAVPGRQAPLPMADSAELVAMQGPLTQQHFPIPSEGLAIGRQPDNDIVLADELTVSRHHAAIALEQGQYVVYDRDSANGTWVNGQRIFRHVLVPGDRIQIWQSEFVFGYPGTPLPAPVSPTLASPVLHIEGDRFAGYNLEDLIGRGGMSEVFKARDQRGRTVAIKILQQSDPYLVSKFMQEGNQIGPLLRDHPNIVYVYEFGQGPDNRLYIVMEYVDAPSLRRVMQRPLSEEEVVGIVGQVCSALAFAHQNNVVHRDIKPENILVTAEGKAKVLDFGIAKLTSASTVTRDKIVGTPEYISPEQARGEPVCPASDVYSLGIVLYELLCGSVPFRRPRDDDALRAAMEVIRQHLKERPEPLRKRNPAVQVSSKLERVTMRALKKEIRERYATAREMGQALGYKEPAQPIASPEVPAIALEQAVPRRTGRTAPEAVLRRASLLVMQGPRRGQRIRLPDGVLALGRLDLGSSNTAISRHHANILYRGGTYWLEDLSKNGTWLDQQRVYGEAPLRAGSVITIGDNVLKLEQG